MDNLKYGKVFLCMSRRLLDHLVANGFTYIRVGAHNTKPGAKVWIFENSKELEKVADEFIAHRRLLREQNYQK